MDVVWSSRHHLVACCAMDENALPLLAFVGGEENGKPLPEKDRLSRIQVTLDGVVCQWNNEQPFLVMS